MYQPLHALRVFLCHSSHDKPAVREVYQKLSATGWIDAWLDEKKLLPGQDWNTEIEKAVESSHIVLIFLTNNSVNKEGYIQRELRLVLDVALNMPEETIFVIPLRLEECTMPRRLRAWQWLDYFPMEQRTEAFERLLESLKTRAAKLGLEGSPYPGRASRDVDPARRNEPASGNESLDLHIPPEYASGTFTPPPSTVKTWIFGGMEFVKVSHGDFLMGSREDNERAAADERPQQKIDIPYDYLMARFPVTNEQFAVFAKSEKVEDAWGVEDWQTKLRHPVVNVTWHQAAAYCEWLNQTFGKDAPGGLVFSLPTEAEWEKAARGTNGWEYPWGNEFDSVHCNSIEGAREGTTPVGAFSGHGDSPYGLCDMAGNVSEWTDSSWIGGMEDPSFHSFVVRGGSFYSDHWGVRAAVRGRASGDDGNGSLGFRVVLAPPLR